MSAYFLTFLTLLSISDTSSKISFSSHEENIARKLMDVLNEEYSVIKHQEALFTYYYNVDTNEENLERMIAAVVDSNRFLERTRHRLASFNWRGFRNQTLKLLFHKMMRIGSAILEEDAFLSYMSLIVNLKKRYVELTVCRYGNCNDCNVRLPEILNIFSKSQNPSELLHYWVAWRNATGPQFLEELQLVYDINNDVASLLDFPNAAEMWISEYSTPNFEKTIMKLWSEIKPLYAQLHAYVRRELRIFYGSRLISENGTIPAHLLGNMWAQKWNVYNLVIPFPLSNFPNITTALLQKDYTIEKMTEEAEDFFQSMSFTKLNSRFWEKSILERPSKRNMSCQASAWDLFTGKDYRLKMCLKVTGADFITLHHNLAHVHYFMEYRNQPVPFRDEPIPGFNEAIADIFTLTIMNPRHLEKVGFLKHYSDDKQTTINYLFQLALQKIVVLPYSLALDLHRWNIFRGHYDPDSHNCEYWKLAEKYQGINPPVERGRDDYDPASMFHVIANKPCVSFFGLHNCDFSGNKEAGHLLKYIMSLGSSVPWQRIMKHATSETKLSAQPLLEFFQPLMDYLEETNKNNMEYVGWTEKHQLCGGSSVHP
ncbi:angiotensin-converting enzyme-like isoform X2 [Belonocnema kinseyi]|uniref:angiotensin-converting enzyme-like isoform X2 n=1 Tax=Belonocnema kinseyi TaxID=2817044 RepID=UPI00143DE87D|nr:angiotensin-converting enzyme-like isoform X2 [Belonocnema kinseyi]